MKMKTNALVSVLLVCVMLFGPVAPVMAIAPTITYRIDLSVKAKAKGAKGRYFETVELAFYPNGTFTTNDITAGTWTGDAKKIALSLPDSDVEYLVETVAAGELGVALQFVSVTSIKGKAKVKVPKGGGLKSIKGTLKIKGVLNAPGLGLFGVKFQIAMKFSGVEKP